MSWSAGSTANEQEACFYCNKDAKKRFCCPRCAGPGQVPGKASYMLCDLCLAERACRYCQRRPEPQDAFTDPDLQSLQQGIASLEGSTTRHGDQGGPSVAEAESVAEALRSCPASAKSPEFWILVEISCVLLYRSPARIKGIQEDGYDGRREPFYIRPGAPEFLREVSRLPQARLALTTTMRPATYQPLLECLAQAAFGGSTWDEASYPLFDNRDVKSHRQFSDGREAPAIDVTGVRRYALDVLGHEMKQEHIILVQSLKEVVSETCWWPNVLLIPAMLPSDLLVAPDVLRTELQQALRYLRLKLLDGSADIRQTLLQAPCSFDRPCKDLALDMDERPPWASEADYAGQPVAKDEDGLEKDSGVRTEGSDGHEWRVLGPSQRSKYEWNGVRFHSFPASCNSKSRFEVTVVQGLVRLGWSTAHGSLDLGKDRGEGFPHVGYGGTGKVCVCGAFSNYGESFGQGDVISCELFLSQGRWAAAFAKNGSVMGQVDPFGTPGCADDMYPHITGKTSFEVKVCLAPGDFKAHGATGRASGEAWVQFASEEIAAQARAGKDRQMIGTRYIEVFPSTAHEAAKASSRPTQERGVRGAPSAVPTQQLQVNQALA
ncbi:Ddx1, partial [Symbiodinium microadriaticum]